MNKGWQQERAKAALEKPQHFGEGLAAGLLNFTTGVAEGVTGLVVEPIRGAQEAGVGGFARGIGLGVIGLVGFCLRFSFSFSSLLARLSFSQSLPILLCISNGLPFPPQILSELFYVQQWEL
jgi:hypothetical protein